jgi:hypothetical protein
MSEVKIVRLRIRDFRGVEALDLAVPSHGMVIRGANGAGKTSVINALRAALAARDIGPDAIRIGAERAEILVDLNCASVRRLITADDSSLDVRNPEGKKLASPQKWLRELLGTSPLDPIEFYKGKPEERRRVLLAALPVEFDSAEAEKAIPTALGNEFAEVLSPLMAKGGHALTVCSAIAKVFFDARTDSSRLLKAAEAEADRIVREGPIDPPGADPLPVLKGAQAALGEIEGAARRAVATASAREGTTARIAELRTRAKAAMTPDPPPEAPDEKTDALTLEEFLRSAEAERHGAHEAVSLAESALKEVSDRFETLRAAFEKARDDKGSADAYLERSKERQRQAELAIANTKRDIADRDREKERAERDAREWVAQADELQRSLSLTDEAPKPEEIEKLRAAVTRAETAVTAHDGAVVRRAQFERTSSLARDLSGRVSELSKLVDHFRETLPKKAIAGARAIDGLALEGDRILLDGVDVDACSGREQLRFATEIARRANRSARILIVDGIETLDPESQTEFVKDATRDGFQLIATRVDAGDVVFDAISAEESSK